MIPAQAAVARSERTFAGWLVVVVVVALSLASGCSPQGPAQPQAELRVAVSYELASLDPHIDNSLEAFEQTSNVYEPLIVLDRGLRLVPNLAASWSNPDATTWSFRLRPGVRFHDGSLLTAEDVVYSIMRLKGDPTLGMRSQLSEVTGATAESGEVVIRTGRPSARLLNELAQVPMVRVGATHEALEKLPNGTGPFAVASWEPGRRLRLRRHEGYWGARPAYPLVDIEMGINEEKAIAGLRAGRFSLVARINRAGVERAALANPRYRLVRQPSLFLTHLAFNVVNPILPGSANTPNPFRRAEVRRAIDLALDRERVAAASPNAMAARHIVTQMVFGHDPEAPAPDRDIDEARRLLASAGYPNGFDVTLHDVNPGPNPPAEEVKAQLAAIGIRVKIAPAPTVEAFFGPLRRREFAFWMAGDGAMTGEAGGLLASQFHSPDLARNLGVENYGGYADPELDRLIEEADILYDPGMRLPVLQKAVRQAERDLFWIPLFHSSVLFVAARDLAFRPREDLVLRYAEIGVAPR
ncbi:MAG: hypothetical protein K1Y01_02310 [Vicinamibacteria bacterium]|nr:hypothetical protein [Vicinamibacteria bacterium]